MPPFGLHAPGSLTPGSVQRPPASVAHGVRDVRKSPFANPETSVRFPPKSGDCGIDVGDSAGSKGIFVGYVTSTTLAIVKSCWWR